MNILYKAKPSKVNILASVQKFWQNGPGNLESCQDLEDNFVLAIETILDSLYKDGKIFTIGNGGSAADAEHIVGELMKGFLKSRKLPANFLQSLELAQKSVLRKQNCYQTMDDLFKILQRLQSPIPAISLVSGVSLPTAFANDVDPSLIFAQQLLGLAKKGDIVLALSTSGNSLNVNLALELANILECKTIGFSGRDGGQMAKLLNVELRVKANSTPKIQEAHLPLYHCLCACLEDLLFD